MKKNKQNVKNIKCIHKSIHEYEYFWNVFEYEYEYFAFFTKYSNMNTNTFKNVFEYLRIRMRIHFAQACMKPNDTAAAKLSIVIFLVFG